MESTPIYAATGLSLLALLVWGIAHVRSLDRDFRQRLLAREMLSAVERGRAGQKLAAIWREEVVRYFIGLYGDLPLSERTARVRHALSKIQPRLYPDEYALLRDEYCPNLSRHRDEWQLA